MPTAHNGATEIWYEAFGDGPPLVLVYGIGGNSRRWWRDFPGLLAERFRVITLDNRGTGHSAQPREPWTMADMVEDIRAVADAEGLDALHLLGCSLGSLVARHFGATYPGRLASLSLLCPPNGISATPEDMSLAILWDPKKARIESERASWLVVHPESFITAHEADLLADFADAEAERTPARTFRFQLDAAAAAPSPDPGVNAAHWPILLLHGTADRLVPPENARSLHAALPRSGLRWIEGASHNFWQHEPEQAAGIVRDFLTRALEVTP